MTGVRHVLKVLLHASLVSVHCHCISHTGRVRVQNLRMDVPWQPPPWTSDIPSCLQEAWAVAPTPSGHLSAWPEPQDSHLGACLAFPPFPGQPGHTQLLHPPGLPVSLVLQTTCFSRFNSEQNWWWWVSLSPPSEHLSCPVLIRPLFSEHPEVSTQALSGKVCWVSV